MRVVMRTGVRQCDLLVENGPTKARPFQRHVVRWLGFWCACTDEGMSLSSRVRELVLAIYAGQRSGRGG